jgi:RHS repeat-associated protein
MDRFGTSIALSALVTDYAVTGREWDNDAGLYYNRARWYDAASGRFISEDPIGFDGNGTNSQHYLKQHLDYDASGKIVRAIDAGGTALALDALFSEYAFSGREWDADAGLYYNRARWYDAASGRFISEDPIGFDGGDANGARSPRVLVEPLAFETVGGR